MVNQISHVSLYEQMGLYATIEGVYNERWNCHKCLTRHERSESYEETTEKERVLKSCYKPREKAFMQLDDFHFHKCIGNFTSDAARNMIDLFMRYDKFGLLPFSGGVAEHPYKVIQYFQMIELIRSEKQDSKEKENSVPDRVQEKLNRKRAKDGQRSTS